MGQSGKEGLGVGPNVLVCVYLPARCATTPLGYNSGIVVMSSPPHREHFMRLPTCGTGKFGGSGIVRGSRSALVSAGVTIAPQKFVTGDEGGEGHSVIHSNNLTATAPVAQESP